MYKYGGKNTLFGSFGKKKKKTISIFKISTLIFVNSYYEFWYRVRFFQRFRRPLFLKIWVSAHSLKYAIYKNLQKNTMF